MYPEQSIFATNLVGPSHVYNLELLCSATNFVSAILRGEAWRESGDRIFLRGQKPHWPRKKATQILFECAGIENPHASNSKWNNSKFYLGLHHVFGVLSFWVLFTPFISWPLKVMELNLKLAVTCRAVKMDQGKTDNNGDDFSVSEDEHTTDTAT